MASSSSAVADKSDDSDSDTLVDEDEEEGTISSLDDGTDRCPICLCRFVDQDIGTPESCDHIFCLECILEWSKKVTTCPVDRQKFHIILVKSASGKGVTRQIVTEEKKLDLEEEESPTYCETCGRCDREDALLLCDGCDVGYHLDCLDPPLTGVPLGDWYCPDCAAENDNEERIADEVAIGIDEVADLIAEGGADLDLPRLRHRQATLTRVARTRFSERVRALVSRNRIQRGEVQLPRVARRPSGTPKKKRKRTTRRRRGTKRGRKRRRRSTKTPKKRIANAIFANTSGDDIHQQRYNAGIRPLNIYGSDLEPSGIDESDIPSTSSGQVKSDQSQQPSFDIIGSILTEQEKLFTSSAKIRINRDGTLELRKEQAAAMEEQLRLRNLNYTPASSTRSCRSSWDKSSSSNSAMQGSTPSVRPIHDVEDPLPPRASSHCMDLNDIMNGDSNQYSPADDPPCSGGSAPSVSSEGSSGTPPKQNGFASVAVPSELASDSHTTTSRPSNGDKKNHMDTIVTHLKNALKPFYCNKQVTKEEYKYIMKQGVKKIYARRSTEIRFEKVKKLVEEYVKKLTAEKQRKKC